MSKRGAVAAAGAAAAMSVAGAGAAQPGKPSAFDRHFLMAAAANDRFEIATATLARRRGQSETVCDLAARLTPTTNARHSRSRRSPSGSA
jgi:hypothetical protein